MIQRFDIRGEQWGLVERQDGLGAFCYYHDAAWYQRQYIMALVINVVVVFACIFLSSYLVYHKHDPQPVSKPAQVEGLSELSSRLDAAIAIWNQSMAAQRKAEAIAQKREQDRSKLIANLESQIKAQNALLDAQQQATVLSAASKMPSQEVVKLAREVGFTNVRVQP